MKLQRFGGKKLTVLLLVMTMLAVALTGCKSGDKAE